MSSTLTEEVAQAMSAYIEPLTVEQYHAMIRQGILMEGAPIELVDGLLVRKDRRDNGGSIMTVGPRHARIVGDLADLLRDLLRNVNVHVREQQPITLNGIQEPEPDVAVGLGRRSDYPDHHPGPGALPLVIEVADSSLDTDRTRKCTNYATAGIPHYWIVNLRDDCVECFENPQPTEGQYQYHTLYLPGQSVVFDVLGQKFKLAVDDILS